jgi:hypothetical protein
LKKSIFLFLVILNYTKVQAQNMGVKLPVSTAPNATLDVNGSTAFREGTALALANGVNTNVVLSDYSLFRLSGPTAAFSITGFTQGKDGRVLTLINSTAHVLTLTHQSTSDLNKQINTGGSNIVVPANNGVVTFIYNATLEKWVVTNGFGVTNNWSLGGNGGTLAGTNFIGTTDGQPLVFKTNDTEWMRLLTSGNLGIGTLLPQNKLDVEGGAVIGATYSGTNTAPTNGLLVEGNVGMGSALKIGTSPSSINASSALEIESTTKGFVPPRMTTAEMNAISTPLVGSLIFNTTLNCLHQYRSAGWESLCLSSTPFTSETLQTSVLTQSFGGSGSAFADIPGLGGVSITVPRTGTYTITARGYFARGTISVSGSNSGAQGSFKLIVDGTSYEESYLASVGVDNLSGNNMIGTQGSIVKILTLSAGTHTVSVQGRSWFGTNCTNATWGVTTSGLSGSGSVNSAWCKLVVVEN